MTNSNSSDVLRQKIGLLADGPGLAGPAPHKAMCLAIARTAKTTWGLEITATGGRDSKVGSDDVAAAFGAGLGVLLQGGSLERGVALIDAQVLAAFVEHLTMGRVAPVAAQDRAPTQTDTMIMAEVLNCILAAFDAEMALLPDAPPISGFRYLGVLEDEKAAVMALEDVPYRAHTLTLDIGSGAKSGTLQLFFPYDPPRKPDHLAREYRAWHKDWQAQVMHLHAPVEAVLHRFSVPVSDISQMQVGSVFQVPASQIAAVTLEGIDKTPVATAKLGQAAGYRAVRINSDVVADPQNLTAVPETPQVAQPVAPLPVEPPTETPALVAKNGGPDADALEQMKNI